jgi:DNA repair protein RadC
MRQSKKDRTSLLASELKVTYKPQKLRDPISDNFTAYSFFLSIWDTELIEVQEQVYALFLDNHDNLICWKRLNIGCLNKCHIDLRLLAAIAVQTFSASVIIAHNHPSGSLQPSADDKGLTNTVKRALSLFEIKLHAHLIITETAFYDIVSGTRSAQEPKKLMIADYVRLHDCGYAFIINDAGQLAVKVMGESMSETWVPGTVLALQRLEDKTLLIWGELYLVMNKRYPAKAGRVYESTGGIEIRFDNAVYRAITIKWDDVIGVYKVKASIKKI